MHGTMLTGSKEFLLQAKQNKYAIPATDFVDQLSAEAYTEVSSELQLPLILSWAESHSTYLSLDEAAMLGKFYAQKTNAPIILHLDHGVTFETITKSIDYGFTSVMIDASTQPFGQNIETTKNVVEYAHHKGVTVEGEIGHVGVGLSKTDESFYTSVEEAVEFAQKTQVDSLAISIGTSHGAFKFKVKTGELPPPLRFDILEECEKRIPGFPIVLHGASSVPQDIVAEINKYGGKMENTVGISEDQLRRAAKSAVCKINIDSDGRLAMTAAIRKVFVEKPGEFDPRNYLGPARDKLRELYKHKVVNVLGSADRA